MVEKLRQLAGKIDKASKRKLVASEELVDDPANQVRLTGFIEDTEGWVVIQVVAGDEDTVNGIVAARNEAPDLLREAADEIERLQDGSLRQYLTDQNTQLREQLVIVCDENEHLQREIERLRRVVQQAIKWLRITDDGIIFASDEVTAHAEEVHDLAQELKEAQ